MEKVTTFTYLGDKIQANGGAHEAARNRIRTAWAKWREVASLLLKKEIALKKRALAYKIYIRSALTYGSETWALTETEKSALNRTELRMLRWMMGTSGYEKSEKYVREITNVESLTDILCSRRLKWYGHVTRMPEQNWIRRCMSMEVEGKRGRGRPAKRWMDLVSKDLVEKGVGPEATAKRVQWRAVVRTKRPNSRNYGKRVVKHCCCCKTILLHRKWADRKQIVNEAADTENSEVDIAFSHSRAESSERVNTRLARRAGSGNHIGRTTE